MDTNCMYRALVEKELEDCIRPEIKAEWGYIQSKHCIDSFIAEGVGNFFPRVCCDNHKKHDKQEPGLFKREFRCSKMLCLSSKTYSCYDKISNKLKFSGRSLNKRSLQQRGDGLLKEHRKVLDERVNITSTNRGF